MGLSRIFIGNLPHDFRETDVRDIFKKYGRFTNLELRKSDGACFAFLEYDRQRDADKAITEEHHCNYRGFRIRVEPSVRDSHFVDADEFDDDRLYSDRERGHEYTRRSRPHRVPRRFFKPSPVRRSDFRIVVSDLPISTSRDELKDFMRDIGKVCFVEVSGNGIANVEFEHEADMKYAVEKCNNTRFCSAKGDVARIRVKKLVRGKSYFSRVARSQSPADRPRVRSRIIAAAPPRSIRSRSPSPFVNGRPRPRSIILLPDGRRPSPCPSDLGTEVPSLMAFSAPRRSPSPSPVSGGQCPRAGSPMAVDPEPGSDLGETNRELEELILSPCRDESIRSLSLSPVKYDGPIDDFLE